MLAQMAGNSPAAVGSRTMLASPTSLAFGGLRSADAGVTDDLGNLRELGVRHLVATCLNDACRHQGLIDVSKYPADTEVPSFANKVVCAKCGARGRHIDVRPNWKELSPSESLTGKVWR